MSEDTYVSSAVNDFALTAWPAARKPLYLPTRSEWHAQDEVRKEALTITGASSPWMQQPVMGAPGTVVVLGARGRLGFACVQAFAQAGWKVWAHVRQGSALVQTSFKGELGAGMVRWTDVSMEHPQRWADLQAECGAIDVVVNAMAPRFSTKAWEADLRALNRSGIRVAKHCAALLVVPLSIVALGEQLPPVVYEDAPLPLQHRIRTRIGFLRAQTELDLRMAAEAGQRICTLRTGAFYGHPGDGWLSGAVLKSLPKGCMTWLGPYDVATPWVYIHDLAQAIERLACQRQQLGNWTRLHFAGHHVSGDQWREAISRIASQHGWLRSPNDLRAGRVHWALWKPLAWFSPRVDALCEMEYVWRTPHQLDNQQLQALIGHEPRTEWLQSVAQAMKLMFTAPAP